MKPRNKLKILNDPIYGFITIPSERIFDLIEHSYFQRLRRISQMGMSYLVYPGAHHTRFHHALGCMHLMRSALDVLKFKGVKISDKEEEALLIAILLHDIGHGPFSHAMENSIVEAVGHEWISLKFMKKMNEDFDGQLSLAIEIFKGNYHRKFFGQLIASQLDIDRLDYLKRDSFYTGVAEGNINSERIITMLNVANDELVIEQKGIYSVEKFLVARRLMYWQVYLHKTSLGAEQLVIRVFKRAKELINEGVNLPCSKALDYFLCHKIGEKEFGSETLETFSRLDDYDLVLAMKEWISAEDKVLSSLCKMVINRDLLKVKLKNQDIPEKLLAKELKAVQRDLKLSETEARYFVFKGKVSNLAYDPEKSSIKIYHKNGKMSDVASVSDQLNLKALSRSVDKFYICHPKH